MKAATVCGRMHATTSSAVQKNVQPMGCTKHHAHQLRPLAVLNRRAQPKQFGRKATITIRAGKMPPPPALTRGVTVFTDTTTELPLLPVVSPRADLANKTWKLKYLYDGGCSVCKALVKMLKSRKGHENIYFEDIASPSFSSVENEGILYDSAMETIHVIKKDRSILQGMDALTSLYEEVGLGWMFKLANLPVFSAAAELIYKMVSKNRMQMGGAMDGVLALGRISMEKKGEGSCSDPEGECRDEPILEPKTDKPEEDANNGEDIASLTPGSNRDHVLGVFMVGNGKGLQAAPVDIKTGKLLRDGAAVPLYDQTIGEVGKALRELDGYFGWDGNLGVGLPGLIARYKDQHMQPGSFILGQDRGLRNNMGRTLRDDIGRDVAVMSGAEANGFGEMAYGAGRGEKGLTMMLTLGTGFGVALFDDGVLVRNLEQPGLDSWFDKERWGVDGANAKLPDDSLPIDDPAWKRWALRVEHYIVQLEGDLHPSVVVIGGAAQFTYKKWAPLMTKVCSKLKCGQLGELAGVKGAAVGASLMLKTRDEVAKIRAALGTQLGASPQKITETQLRKVFDECDVSQKGTVSYSELAGAVKALGVIIPKEEMRELMTDVFESSKDRDKLSFDEFTRWWREMVPVSSIEFLQTAAEFDQVLAEETPSNRLVVLQVGFTFCRPCKAFEPRYKEFAQEFSDARFLKIYGNGNRDMTHLARKRLTITATPTFYMFRKGEEVNRHSGASAFKFEQNLRLRLIEGEVGYDPDFEYTEPPPKAAPSNSDNAGEGPASNGTASNVTASNETASNETASKGISPKGSTTDQGS